MGRGGLWVVEPGERLVGAQLLFLLLAQRVLTGQKTGLKTVPDLYPFFPLPLSCFPCSPTFNLAHAGGFLLLF